MDGMSDFFGLCDLFVFSSVPECRPDDTTPSAQVLPWIQSVSLLVKLEREGWSNMCESIVELSWSWQSRPCDEESPGSGCPWRYGLLLRPTHCALWFAAPI